MHTWKAPRWAERLRGILMYMSHIQTRCLRSHITRVCIILIFYEIIGHCTLKGRRNNLVTGLTSHAMPMFDPQEPQVRHVLPPAVYALQNHNTEFLTLFVLHTLCYTMMKRPNAVSRSQIHPRKRSRYHLYYFLYSRHYMSVIMRKLALPLLQTD